MSKLDFASESALPVLTGDVDAGPHCVSPTQGGEHGLIGVGLSSINARAGREWVFLRTALESEDR